MCKPYNSVISPTSRDEGRSDLFEKIKMAASFKSLCTSIEKNSAFDVFMFESSAESRTYIMAFVF